MPCYSTITKTKMTDAEYLALAMEALGYKLTSRTKDYIAAAGIDFSRTRDGVFQTTTTDVEKLQAIQRKYAETGVRAWAKRSGYSVTENDGRNLTLINRRK